MEQKKIRVPRKGDRVWVAGGKEVFVVLQVHKDTQFASLKSLDGKKVRPMVPWDALKFPNEDASQAAARIVREATKDQ